MIHDRHQLAIGHTHTHRLLYGPRPDVEDIRRQIQAGTYDEAAGMPVVVERLMEVIERNNHEQ